MAGASEERPAGAGVVVTRDEAGDGPLTTLLSDRGLRVYHWPTIRFDPPDDDGPLEAALAALDTFDWAVFTSPRAVDALRGHGGPPWAPRPDPDPGREAGVSEPPLMACPPSLGVAAVGESTASALVDGGWSVDVVPDEFTGEALVVALSEAGVGGGHRVFFPASAIARDVVPDGLRRLGAEVVQVVAYRTVVPPLDTAACRTALETGAVSIITFTSPSTVQNLQAELGPEVFDLAVRCARAVAIGPTTAEAVREAGWGVVAEADPHTLEGLADRAAREAARDSIQEAT